jgi:ubiquinone biosynthesis protein
VNIKTLAQVGRFKEIVSVLVKYGFGDVVDMLDLPGKKLAHRIAATDPEKTTFERIRLALDELGPTFVKFGQIMSLRSELLPKPMVEELQNLQDNASPIDVVAVRQVIEQTLMTTLEEVCILFDDTPLAAASLSQVHRGVLRSDRSVVAFKVQRPDIRDKIERDLGIMAAIAERLHERVEDLQVHNLPALVALVRRTLERELDFSREARYMQIAGSYMRDVPGIYVPEVFTDLTTERLLVMEYVEGESLRDLSPAELERPERLACRGLRATVKQILEDGFFHADPHPGNILILDGKTIGLLDWGMVGRLTPKDRQELIDLLAAVVEKDSERLVDAILAIAESGTQIDRRSLERDLLDLLDAHLTASVAELRLGQLMMEIMDLMRDYRLSIPSDLFMMIKSLVTAEGAVRRIYPQLDVVSEVRPYVSRLAKERFKPEVIWHNLRALVFKLAVSPTRFPRRISDIVEKMERGQLRIGFEHRNLSGLQNTFEKIFSRLTMGVIVAAMIIGSSMIITTGLPPLFHGYPLLGLIGFLISGVFGLWLIYDIVRNR